MSSRSRWVVPVVAIVLVALLLAPFGWSRITEGVPPAPLGLQSAEESTPPAAEPSPGPFDVDGTWVVSAGSEAGFRVEATGDAAGTVVGRTGEVSGTVTVRAGTVRSADVRVDAASIETGDATHDRLYRRVLETEVYPTALFTLTRPVDVDALESTEEPVPLDADGTLTIREVTRPVTVSLEAQRSGDGVLVSGAIPVQLPDYGVAVPADAPVQVADTGTVEVRLELARAPQPRPTGGGLG